jgi:hypothetical protein
MREGFRPDHQSVAPRAWSCRGERSGVVGAAARIPLAGASGLDERRFLSLALRAWMREDSSRWRFGLAWEKVPSKPAAQARDCLANA